ncbi:MAG: hypothetical protein LBQ61_10490 [Spirochaetales bacterium]|jgi:hypothetical protein|nr:hypothetical protein [Spirochaetales bacterium]
MARSNRRLPGIFAFLCLLLVPLESQEGLPRRLAQTLIWPEDENASRYEVTIEKNEGGAWQEAMRRTSERAGLEVSLPPGNYRYRVMIYNLLHQPEYLTPWATFTVIPARQPEIRAFEPAFFTLGGGGLSLRIEGRNLDPQGEIFLIEDSPAGERRIPPESRSLPSGTAGTEELILFFSPGDLSPGSFWVVIRNPGGLEAGAGPVIIGPAVSLGAAGAREKTPLDLGWEAGLGYEALLPVYGFLLNYFNEAAYPLGARLEGGLVLGKKPWGRLGIQAGISGNRLETVITTAVPPVYSIPVSGNMISLSFGLLYKKYFQNDRLSFNVRLGGGVTAFANFLFHHPQMRIEKISTWMFNADAGLSLQYYFLKNYFAFIGLNGQCLFSADKPYPVLLRPVIGAGVSF